MHLMSVKTDTAAYNLYCILTFGKGALHSSMTSDISILALSHDLTYQRVVLQ